MLAEGAITTVSFRNKHGHTMHGQSLSQLGSQAGTATRTMLEGDEIPQPARHVATTHSRAA
jgi:hypothetical protein